MTQEKPYHHGSLKKALIAAGIEILDARGLEALSLRAIAAHVGVSHTAPKNHFGSLKGLLTAIAAEGFVRHAEFMRAGSTADAKARQKAAIHGYVRFARAHPHLFRLMFSPAQCNFEDTELRAAAAGSYSVLQGIAKDLEWDKAGAANSDYRAQLMLWSLVHGFAMLDQTGMSAPDGPLLEIEDIMPDFGYLPAANPTKAPPR